MKLSRYACSLAVGTLAAGLLLGCERETAVVEDETPESVTIVKEEEDEPATNVVVPPEDGDQTTVVVTDNDKSAQPQTPAPPQTRQPQGAQSPPNPQPQGQVTDAARRQAQAEAQRKQQIARQQEERRRQEMIRQRQALQRQAAQRDKAAVKPVPSDKAQAARKEQPKPPALSGTASAPLVVVAEVETPSKVPDPSSVPYKDALTFVKYRVVSVEKGSYAPKEILAVHWGMQNGKLAPAARLKEGEKKTLYLEPFSKRPELARVMQADDTNEFELTPYYVVEAK